MVTFRTATIVNQVIEKNTAILQVSGVKGVSRVRLPEHRESKMESPISKDGSTDPKLGALAFVDVTKLASTSSLPPNRDTLSANESFISTASDLNVFSSTPKKQSYAEAVFKNKAVAADQKRSITTAVGTKPTIPQHPTTHSGILGSPFRHRRTKRQPQKEQLHFCNNSPVRPQTMVHPVYPFQMNQATNPYLSLLALALAGLSWPSNATTPTA
jgi:hypothetical protein